MFDNDKLNKLISLALLNNNINLLFIGVAYKPNVDDIRESPALHILNSFIKIPKYNLYYHDPYVNFIKTSKYKNLNKLKSTKLSKLSLLTSSFKMVSVVFLPTMTSL